MLMCYFSSHNYSVCILPSIYQHLTRFYVATHYAFKIYHMRAFHLEICHLGKINVYSNIHNDAGTASKTPFIFLSFVFYFLTE